LCIALGGDITLLTAIYSMAFLLVMALFAGCGAWMKAKRPSLPRPFVASTSSFIWALVLVSVAFMAVLAHHAEVLTYFFLYYGTTVALCMITFARVPIMTVVLGYLQGFGDNRFLGPIEKWASGQLASLKSCGVIFLTKSADISGLNQALLYILENEESRNVLIVHVFKREEYIPKHLIENIQLLDCQYPKVQIDGIFVKGEFSPHTLNIIEEEVGIPLNCMFMSCPTNKFQHRLDKMKGVRVIINAEGGKTDPLEEAKKEMAAMDADGDGQFDRSEWLAFFGDDEKFDEYDTDGDGNVTQDDFLRYFRESKRYSMAVQ